jgi:hypothetical protein
LGTGPRTARPGTLFGGARPRRRAQNPASEGACRRRRRRGAGDPAWRILASSNSSRPEPKSRILSDCSAVIEQLTRTILAHSLRRWSEPRSYACTPQAQRRSGLPHLASGLAAPQRQVARGRPRPRRHRRETGHGIASVPVIPDEGLRKTATSWPSLPPFLRAGDPRPTESGRVAGIPIGVPSALAPFRLPRFPR